MFFGLQNVVTQEPSSELFKFNKQPTQNFAPNVVLNTLTKERRWIDNYGVGFFYYFALNVISD